MTFAQSPSSVAPGTTLPADPPETEATLTAALQLAVALAGASGGLLLMLPDAPSPGWAAQCHPPAAWIGQLDDARSAMWRLAADPARPDPALGLVAAVEVLGAAGERLAVLALANPSRLDGRAPWLPELAALLGRALRAHRSVLNLRDPGQELAALNKIAATLTSTLQLDEILNSTVDGIRQILNVEAASLIVLDQEQGELIFKKTLGEDSDWIFQYNQIGQGLVGECIRTGQPLLVNDAAGDPRFSAPVDGVAGFDTRAVLCAPLIARGRVLGAIEVVNKRTSGFDAHDQDLLVSMTASVANAIHNARLFHQLNIANAGLEASRWEVVRSHNTLQALFHGITHPIYIVDQDYRLVAVNLAGEQLARSGGAAPEVLVGALCHQALYGRAEVCPGCRVAETLTGGHGTHRVERRWQTDDQHTEWEISTFPIRDETAQVTRVVVFGQDVTEKRRLEASLAQSEKLAAVGQLAAGVAHEINNPLAAIIANTQLLQRELAPDDERQESVSLIALAGDRALRVVRSLLDFARQERYELTHTDVNDSIRSAITLVEQLTKAGSVQLVCDLAADLPPILASHDHLQGVWLNLLLNARDALAGGAGEVRIATRRQGQEVLVVVSDTGVGIAPERLSRIFEPFYTTKEPGRGTGLGLSSSHRIVKQHGGLIRVDSRVGHGTVFTVVLPAADPV